MANLAFTMATIRSQLKRCTNTEDGCRGCCPAHDDGTPSLNVTRKHDRILVRCMAGCDTQNVLDRLGLEYADLFADGVESHRGKFNVRPSRPAPSSRPAEEPPPDFGPLLKAARQLPTHRQRLLELADELGALPESREAYADAAEAIGVVWLPKAPSLYKHLPGKGRGWRACWGVPERDATGHVIGVSRRYPGGQKRSFPGGKRGLTYAPQLLSGTGPIACPEGASDVIALLAANLRAIGRPSNVGGVELLSELISTLPAGETVVVVGENDGKVGADGKVISPGREGMDRTAEKLSQSLPSHRVAKALPPAESKDSRAALQGRSGVEAGLWLLASMTFVERPHVPIDDQKREEECVAAPASDLLAGLHKCPPRCVCQRGGAAHVRHKEDRHQGGFMRRACGSWFCPVCLRRNSHEWATHLADCYDQAAKDGFTIYAGEIARDRFDATIGAVMKRWKRRGGGHWSALELLPGVLLVVTAVPRDASPLDGTEPVSLEAACAKLVGWAASVKSGPEPFSKKNKNARPVRTSDAWRLNREEPTGDWEVAGEVDTVSPDPVIDVLKNHPARVTMDTTEPGDKRDGGSLVWFVRYRVDDPEEHERIAKSVRSIDARPAPPPPGSKRKRPEDDLPPEFENPGG